MPRKMAGMAMITIDASIVAMVMLSVVLDRATHLYRSCPPCSAAWVCACPLLIAPTSDQPTWNNLLYHNYLPSERRTGVMLRAANRANLDTAAGISPAWHIRVRPAGAAYESRRHGASLQREFAETT